MTTLNKKLTKKNEKGIALIFTLIMLSLLMILALSFAMDSMFSQKAAYNSASSSSAGLLAKAQLNQVMTLIEQEATNFATGNVYSLDSVLGYSTSPAGIYTDMLQERMPVPGILDDSTDISCLKPTVKVNWNFIRSNAPDNRIIGRTAFVVIPDEKIPLPSLLDKRAGTTDYPKHNEKDDWETRIGKYVSEINVRNAIPETSNPSSPTYNSAIATIADSLNYKNNGSIGFPNGKYTGIWNSYDDLFNTLSTAPNAVTLTNPQKSEFQKNLNIRASDDEEAFWVDINSNSKLDVDDELFRRFDLTRTDWNKTSSADDLAFIRTEILMDSAGTGSPAQAMQKWSKSDGTALTTGLPWLACFGIKADGAPGASSLKKSFPSIAARRNQIAANLKDYCDYDKDSLGNPVIRPTSDVPPKDWADGTTHPTFTGNEQTPYINKIGVQIKACQGQTKTGSHFLFGDTYDIYSLIEVYPYIELINIYKPDFTIGANCKVKVEGKVKLKTALGSNSDSQEFTFNKIIDIPSGTLSNGYSSFIDSGLATIGGGLSFETTHFDNNYGFDGKKISVEVTEVVITKAVFYKDDTVDQGYDYVKQLADGGDVGEMFKGDSSDSPGYCWYGWAAHDPRQNLNEDDWEPLTPQTGDDATLVLSLTGSPGGPYTGASNAAGPDPTESPSAGNGMTADKEHSSDPANLSTAYIRNAPMQSPWELGFIHRGARWQTINLKMHDPTKAIKACMIPPSTNYYIAGGESYLMGDANILDQIKMTPDALSPQKINLNSSALDNFIALLNKVRYNCTIDNNMSVNSIAGVDSLAQSVLSGTQLSAADIKNIGNSIIDKYNLTVNPEYRLTRASVVLQLLLLDVVASTPTKPIEVERYYATPAIPSANINDAIQEELIGKIVNLTKLGSKTGYFTVIVLAQSIKDVGGKGTDTIPISKYSVDGLTSDTQDCKIGVFDAKINDQNDFKKNIYYDEITGEQKIMLKGRSLGGGKIKIISFQYVD